ncbi:MAG: tetrahydromethanopterin S-methyltransferase subunit H [Candidatus Diapherotrites archaeon]|nr:tetrahydromethanopterin S-methyltransferase subunit H [Candidatus Diapherotrites archaeon]
MFVFSKPQKIFDIAGTKIGGQPGQTPTMLCGTIFYSKHNILTGESGSFDSKRAEDLINKQLEASDSTGIPGAIQIFADSPQSMEERIDFACNLFEGPIIIDSTESETRLYGAEYATETGVSDQMIYNSINFSVTEKEITELKNTDVESAIILLYNPKDSSLAGKLNLLCEDNLLKKSLVDIAKEAGVQNFLIDTATTPLGHGAAASVRAVSSVKAKFGLPSGNGIHNAISSWEWLSDSNHKKFKNECNVAANSMQMAFGSNFLLFGPIELAENVFPAAAFVHEMQKEAENDFGLNIYK